MQRDIDPGKLRDTLGSDDDDDEEEGKYTDAPCVKRQKAITKLARANYPDELLYTGLLKTRFNIYQNSFLPTHEALQASVAALFNQCLSEFTAL